ncbi:MAG: PH domain-containing protein [Cystobacter sp.]
MSAPLTRQASAWVYRGVWALLSDLFHVPHQPPALPVSSGGQVLAMRPCDGWLRYRKVSYWLVLLSTVLPLALCWPLVLMASPTLALWLLAPIVLTLLVPALIGYVSIHLDYDTTWYVLSERALRIRRGVWTIHETTITFDNVQNVKITQGPLQRLFGFSDLVVETAGGGGSQAQNPQMAHGSHVGLLQGIEDPNALREQIMVRVKASRSAGLGDEHDTELAPTTPSAIWSPEHLEALRKIATHAARLRARAGG